MSEVLTQALQITVLGMGLVFGAIIVLWLMMALLTSVTAEKKPQATATVAPASSGLEKAQKAQAAAIGVVLALAEQEACEAHALPTPPTAIVSAWQLGMRTRLLAQKGHTRRR